jgi:hypothetical protein
MSTYPVERRKISELITLYTLEPELCDIYVEGISDKILINRYLQHHQCDTNIIEIDDIDFSELYGDHPHLKSNCKNKIIAMARSLNENFLNALSGVMCIADRDFDDLFGLIEKHNYLYYTDFSSAEVYFFNEESVNIFFRDILHDFPVNAEEVIRNLQVPLNALFNIKASLIEVFGPELEVNNFNYSKLIEIDKRKGSISLNHSEYINRFLNSRDLMYGKLRVETAFAKFSTNKIYLPISKIRGHDLVNLFYAYFDKIKNNIKLSLEAFDRLLFMCVDLAKVDDYSLFKLLKATYSRTKIL